MKRFLLILALFLLYHSANAQSAERIYYYYKGQKIYYPVSYNRLVAEMKPGYSFTVLQNHIANLLKIPKDSVEQTFVSNQLIVKRNANPLDGASLSALQILPGLLFIRPVFVTPSGNYNSYGKTFIVKLKSATRYTRVKKLMRDNGCVLVRHYPFQDDIFILAAGENAGYDGLAMANLFYETGLFDYAEPDKFVYHALHVVPNDPLYNLQWAHNNAGTAAQFNGTPGADMKIQQAWDISMGQSYIKIAVIDEGVDLTHPDLQANLLQGFNGATLTSNPGDGAPLGTANAHGTNCAGIIAAIANNNLGMAGVAPNCKIIPAVIFNAAGNYLGDAAVAASFDYVRLTGADVISNSWGGGSVSSTIDAAINRAVTLGRYGKGCMVLVSSGNDNASTVSYPANNSQVISVGGVSMCNQRKSPVSCDGENWWGAKLWNRP
ncbi:MAG: S8 family serine peptidase [Chitinophagaceae bacterium]|nr:S8 family serine peptidase [Chitinophagaceae bacterium]